MKKKFTLIIALALLALLLAVAPVSAGAIVTRTVTEVLQDGIWTDEYEVDGVDFDNCPDVDIEDILVQGSYTIKTTTVLDGNGGAHSSFHFNWAGITGTGLTSGDTYVVPQVISNTDYYHQGGFPTSGTGTLTFQLVSKGSGENVRVKGVWHFTINANGELTIDKDTFINIVCK